MHTAHRHLSKEEDFQETQNKFDREEVKRGNDAEFALSSSHSCAFAGLAPQTPLSPPPSLDKSDAGRLPIGQSTIGSTLNVTF